MLHSFPVHQTKILLSFSSPENLNSADGHKNFIEFPITLPVSIVGSTTYFETQ